MDRLNRLLATVMTGPLAAGGSQSFNQLVTIPRDVPTGPALIRVIADAPNGISESEEGNNVAEFRIVLIRPGP
jgi:subtilase family serine protease